MSSNAINWDKVQQQLFAEDPAYKQRWESLAFARAVSTALLRYRQAQNLSQRALARQLAMPQSQVARLELAEHNPTIETVSRLARALDVAFLLSIEPRGSGITLPAGAEELVRVDLSEGGCVRAAIASSS